MSGRRRHRTVSLSLEDRGQTTQDFAVGIGIFILAIAFVFAFVPMIITPYTDAAGPETAQAERISGTVVSDLSDDDPNSINTTDFDQSLAAVDDEDLARNLSLRIADGHSIDRVNITIETLGPEPDVVRSAGHDYDGQAGASTTRIVSMDDDVYKLVVRVW